MRDCDKPYPRGTGTEPMTKRSLGLKKARRKSIPANLFFRGRNGSPRKWSDIFHVRSGRALDSCKMLFSSHFPVLSHRLEDFTQYRKLQKELREERCSLENQEEKKIQVWKFMVKRWKSRTNEMKLVFLNPVSQLCPQSLVHLFRIWICHLTCHFLFSTYLRFFTHLCLLLD